MQQLSPMFRVMPSFPPTNITTDQIQKYLDENKKLIVAILENQNLGKLAECAQYQAQLQKNLMYLAAIADGQGQPQTPPKMTSHPAMQQGGFYTQHPQATAFVQQPSLFPQKAPAFNSPHLVQEPQQHLAQQPHSQPTQGQMALRPIGATYNMQPPQSDVNLGAGSNNNLPTSNWGPTDIHGGNKQDKRDGGFAAGSDGNGNSGSAHGSEEGNQGAK